MTLLLIIAAAIFTVVAAYHLVLPFLSSHEEKLRFEVLDEDLRRVEELAAKKATLLQTLRDVEFDYETEKITEADYRHLKKRYERQAIQVMRELDELHGGRGWEEAIDKELAQRLERLAAQKEAKRRDARSRNLARAESARLVNCPECGKEMEADARFCSQCGTTLAGDDSGESEDNQAPVESRALPNAGSEVAT